MSTLHDSYGFIDLLQSIGFDLTDLPPGAETRDSLYMGAVSSKMESGM